MKNNKQFWKVSSTTKSEGTIVTLYRWLANFGASGSWELQQSLNLDDTILGIACNSE